MQINLVDGQFDVAEGLSLISRLVEVKIRFHEEKINSLSAEEDIKMRENRVQKLQKQLEDLRGQLNGKAIKLQIKSEINIQSS